MNDKKSDPPRLAIWWLRHAFPGSNHEAFTGDLIERFREGQTRGWFWRQVLIAFAVGILGEVRSHWPQVCYAIAGAEIPTFLTRGVDGFQVAFVHWYAFPWPWSMLFSEMKTPAILAMTALPVLAVGLTLQRTFRWPSLLSTAIITLVLITFIHFLPDAFPWLIRRDGNHTRLRVVYQILLFFSFLVSAWVGCRSPRRADAEIRVS